MIRFHAHCPCTPFPLSGPATLRKTEKERQLADGRGGKEVDVEPNHTTARKPGPLKIKKSFNPYCLPPSITLIISLSTMASRKPYGSLLQI
jgi:hypothetical protein